MLVFTAFANSPSNAEIKKRVENLNTIIDLKVTDEVTSHIHSLITRRKKGSEAILGRTSLYFPIIENALRERNLPDELKYIAVIESGLMPDAESHQGAAGLWQFMKPTGLNFGLRIDKYVDERKDYIKATNKALDYLEILYNLYDNWTIALAAYNCGSGNMNKAISKAGGSSDFWEIRRHLPRETQKYIPKFIAVSYLMNYYYIHDLKPTPPADELKYVSAIRVYDKVEFKRLSKEYDLDLDIIKLLNPTFNKDFIPGSENEIFYLILPEKTMIAYVENTDTRMDVPFNPILLATKSESSDEVIAAMRIEIDIQNLAPFKRRTHAVRDNIKSDVLAKNIQKNMTLNMDVSNYYKMKRKESLSDVADANSITIAELMEINNIDEKTGLAPGSLIKLSR
jgi:membrane-bound lytic murein transglycosylase D